MTTLLILVALIHNALCSTKLRMDRTEVIKSSEGPYGTKSNWIYCNDGSFAKGFGMNIEKETFFSKIKRKIGVEDKVGAYSFWIICDNNEIIKSSNSKQKGKDYQIKCRKGEIIGFSTKLDATREEGDSTGINSIQAYCSSNSDPIVLNKKGKGEWGEQVKCNGNAKVCGFRQKVDFYLHGSLGDDSGLNAVQLACCGNRDKLETKIWKKPHKFEQQQQIVHVEDVLVTNEEAPTFDIYLSDRPSVYLKPVCEWFKKTYGLQKLDSAYKIMMKKIPKFAEKMFIKYAKEYLEKPDERIGEPYYSEMKYYVECVGKELNYNIVDVVKLNLLYEFAYIACTSIVCIDKYGHILHGRNFDFPTILRNYSIHLTYYENHKSKKILYHSIGLFAFVGTATAVKPNAFGISMNLRRAWDILNNLKNLNKHRLPSSWIIRECLMHDNTYDKCKQRVLKTHILAPAYYIMSGIDNTDKGAIIARSPIPGKLGETVQEIKELGSLGDSGADSSGYGWFIAETNFDDWHESGTAKGLVSFLGLQKNVVGKQVLYDNRLAVARKLMNEIGPNKIDIDTLYTVMSTPPVLAKNTVFTSIFSPSFKIMNYVNVTIRRNRKILKFYETQVENPLVNEQDTKVEISNDWNNNYLLQNEIIIAELLIVNVMLCCGVGCVIGFIAISCCVIGRKHIRKYQNQIQK
eukprot:533278_1